MSTDRILSRILGSGAASGFAGGLAGGLASGVLTSKAGRKLGRKALQVGGIAALGGLAHAAWSRHNQASAASAPDAGPWAGKTPATRERFVPPPSRPREAEDLGYVLLQAMVAAAHADGRLDAVERQGIRAQIDSLGLSAGEHALLLDQIENPPSLAELVAAANTPEQACEIYAASLLAIDVDTPAERAYLAMLAARLGLTDELIDAIHLEAGVESPVAHGPRRIAS